MTKQDGQKPLETQPEPLLPISFRPGAHYGRLQESMGPFEPVGPRREVEIVTAPF